MIMDEYEKEIPEFHYRLKVKAGLTGYAQVYGKYNTTPYDKLKLDLFYIENYSLLLDIKLLFMTVKIFFQKEVSEGVEDTQVNALKDSGEKVSEEKTELKMGTELRDLQLVELDILKEFLRICKKYDLRYYALGGTLLGAVRHKGFIPWDDDVDMGMPRPDFIRFGEIAKKEFPQYIRFCTYQETPGYRYYVPRLTDRRVKVIDSSAAVEQEKEAWIDIFPLDGMPGNKWKRKFSLFSSFSCQGESELFYVFYKYRLKEKEPPLFVERGK